MKTLFNFILGVFIAGMVWVFWTCLWTAILEFALK